MGAIRKAFGMGPSKAEQIAELRHELARLQESPLARRIRSKREASGTEMIQGRYEYELNDGLRNPDKWETLAKMETDPHVKGALRFNTLPLITGDWDIAAASDEPRDIEVRDFVAANLLRESNENYGRDFWVATPWKAQRLPEILQMLSHGFAMFHKRWKQVGTKVVYERLHWLEPSSVDPRGWVVDDDDEFMGVKRTFRRPSGMLEFMEPIPREELALYVWELRGGRLEGNPFIRPMYGAWLRKDIMLRAAVIWVQKVGAPAPVGSYPPDWSADNIQKFKTFVAQLRGSSTAEAFLAAPQDQEGNGPKISYAGAQAGEVDRVRGNIDGENKEIGHAGATKSMMLGETQTGSRALGQTTSTLELIQVQAIGEYLAEVETHGTGTMPGLIEELVDANFAGIERYPTLVPPEVDPFANLGMVDKLLNAVKAGVLPNHVETRKQVAAMFKLELPDEAFEQDNAPVPFGPGIQPPPPRDTSRGGGDQDDDDPDQDMDDDDEPPRAMAEAVDTFRKRISGLLEPAEVAPGRGGRFRRGQTKLETMTIHLAEIDQTMRVGERDLLMDARKVHAGMVADVLSRLRSGQVAEDSLDDLRSSKYRGQSGAENRFRRTMNRIGRQGMNHVTGELRRQGEG